LFKQKEKNLVFKC